MQAPERLSSAVCVVRISENSMNFSGCSARPELFRHHGFSRTGQRGQKIQTQFRIGRVSVLRTRDAGEFLNGHALPAVDIAVTEVRIAPAMYGAHMERTPETGQCFEFERTRLLRQFRISRLCGEGKLLEQG